MRNREPDEDDRREAMQQRRERSWRRPTYRTYDDWKLASPDDELPPQEPPPCERSYLGRIWQHPRYPSGYCVECGAEPHQACKHELAVGEYAPREP